MVASVVVGSGRLTPHVAGLHSRGETNSKIHLDRVWTWGNSGVRFRGRNLEILGNGTDISIEG